MNNKLMITAAFVALAGLCSPALVFVSNAAETTTVQTSAIDYSAMDNFLSKLTIVENGRPRIAYDAVRDKAGPFLGSYIDYLSQQNVDALSQDDQLAYWLNVQNALVVQAISFDTKKTNLKKLRGSGESPGKLWTTPRFNYGAMTLSIAEIENSIVSKNEDPNVLYGLYQGVRGGPGISRIAYQGATVRTALSEAGKTYVNSKGIVRSDNQTAKITPIYIWHKDALFGGDDAALITHVRNLAEPGLASALYKAKTVESIGLNYRTDEYEAPRRRDARTRGSARSSGGSARSGGGYGS